MDNTSLEPIRLTTSAEHSANVKVWTRLLTWSLSWSGMLLVLACPAPNGAKAGGILALGLVVFWPLRSREIVLFLASCLVFTLMDALSIRRGLFAFSQPDVLGLPYYEFFMWGFYLLHTVRTVGGRAPEPRMRSAGILALLLSMCFGTLHEPLLLLAGTGACLALGLALFHEKEDLAYVGYMLLLGTAVEYAGVWSGQWKYPEAPFGGVPLWFVTMWGGVGLLLRRLGLPILARFTAPAAEEEFKALRFPAPAIQPQ